MAPRSSVDTSVRHFLYPLNPTSMTGYVFIDDSGTEWPTSYEGFLASLDYDKPTEWGLSTGFRKVRAGDMVWAYFVQPDGAIRAAGRIRNRPHWNQDWKRWVILIDWDRALTDSLGRRPIPYQQYQQHVRQAVVEANAKTSRLLNSRAERNQSKAQRNRDAAVRFAQRKVDSRLGQADFRQSLLRAYNNRCAVTGCSVGSALEAAHIRGVRDGGNHTVTNGLLLRADIHSLFDVGLVWIDDKLRIRVDPSIADTDYRRYHGVRVTLPAARRDQPSASALRRHREIHQR